MKFLSLTFFLSSLAWCQITIIHAGKLICGTSKDVKTVYSILIEKDKIIDVVEGYVDPGDGDQQIDLNDYTVIPGLMDMHVHLSGESNPKKYMDRFTMNLDDYAYQSVSYAEKTLMAGFTTVRDLGGPINTSLKKAIEKNISELKNIEINELVSSRKKKYLNISQITKRNTSCYGCI